LVDTEAVSGLGRGGGSLEESAGAINDQAARTTPPLLPAAVLTIMK
jgi:hypothetical protein